MNEFNSESENLKKLHEIVKIFESQKETSNINDIQHKELNEKIDSLIHHELKKIEYEDDNNSKLKCYETLFTTIIGLLEGAKQII